MIKENKCQQDEIEMFARVVNVLEVESDQLRGQQGLKRAPVMSLHPAPGPGR